VAAIFASRLLNGEPPLIFEDGHQSRDVIHVKDIVDGILRAFESDAAAGSAVDLGTGRATSVREIASLLAAGLGIETTPIIVDKYRLGDIRHCYADPSRASELLGFEAGVTLEEGMTELVHWLAGQTSVDRVEMATTELAARGLTR
jgi:dTDP-L-rhamnose 4-epimerase